MHGLYHTKHNMIQFIKIAPYELHPEDKDTYQYLADLTMGRTDPPSLAPSSLSPDADIILCSPLRRAIECVQTPANAILIPTKELAEVRFNLETLCPRDVWNIHGSASVRKAFVEAFIADTLEETRETILSDIEHLLAECDSYTQAGKTAACISHSFKMKLIQGYIATKGTLAQHPERVREFIVETEHTFAFGGGFEI